MLDETSYTPEEIAALLKISKLKVYDLIKKGEIPSYRVGKQMRVDSSDLEAYKLQSKGVHAKHTEKPIASAISTSSEHATAGRQDAHLDAARGRSVIITGQDISLDILAKYLERQATGARPLRSYVGSMESLISMYQGESDIVSTHLLDGDTGEYNIPYIRKLFVGQPVVVVNLLSRSAGFYVQKGNPHKLQSWADLGKTGIRLVNRERGSGARVLLDEQLRLHDIRPSKVAGYSDEENSHIAVAGKVAAGEADVGVGIEKAAQIVGGVDFVPLIQERYDLVMLKRPENRNWIEAVIAILRSESFRNELAVIHGYDLSRTGEIVYES
ncbi:helix-turn-helix transcriptional regulator [Paenibacillus beijingensis]|uniref:Excisionase n=1 Tax=Paenibacillus beijingensis TaxID=1126833 RepID=A0A0D5NJJ9_9BACL|nr:helix-turn-helix transcriptional regulator [Paenibacillus beijingensis]AJY75152.1 hypothetical protein VN24_11885 [Paenibacillus beijingensis]